MTLASPRYEVQASILLKKFLAKFISLGIGVKMASLGKSHVTVLCVPNASFVSFFAHVSHRRCCLCNEMTPTEEVPPLARLL